MKFCPICRNMYYTFIDPENDNALVYNCQCCGNTEKITDKADLCVSRIDLKSNTQHYQNIINDSTINDPTLPHLNDRLCPNTDCATNKDRVSERDCVYICYDKPNMKYVFICTTCNTKWTS
jgi:hypothetical protein